MCCSYKISFAIICLVVILAITDGFNVRTRSATIAKPCFGEKDGSIRYDGGNSNNSIDDISEISINQLPSRRGILQRGISVTAAMVGTGSSSIFPQSARAAKAKGSTVGGRKTDEKMSLMSTLDVAELLHPVPTFTIVDEKGVPFTVVGEDAKVTGYFFTSYPEASRILRLAKTSADKAINKAKADGKDSLQEIGTNPWKKARISTLPLDYAVTLVSKSNQMRGLYFKVAPAEEDVDDALAVTGATYLSEGKVPLFYYEDFTIDTKEDDGTRKTPLYFRKEELEKDWRRLNPKKETPKINVTELFSLLSELVSPGGTDNELRNLVFVSPKESKTKRAECLKKGGNEAPFIVGKTNIVL